MTHPELLAAVAPASASRRQWLKLLGAGATGSLLGLGLGLPARAAAPSGRVVVVGGGMAGAAAAKYLRYWGGSGVQVTLVDPTAVYTSNIMSNLVLNGSRSLASLNYSRSALASRHGVQLRQAAVSALNPAAKTLQLSDGSSLGYDRLILAPGLDFDPAYGLSTQDYELRTPHAWQAGPQTELLRQKLAAVTANGTFVLTIPKAPYRCPPGPYERACIVADFLKQRRGAGVKVLVLDENLAITAERENFTHAFNVIHAGVVDYRPGITQLQINAATGQVRWTDALGQAQSVVAEAINPIPPQRARGSRPGEWMQQAGLINGAEGRWAVVDLLSYESTAVPFVHVIGDAAQTGLPKAGHVGNQEGKTCADAVLRLLAGGSPDPAPVLNSACYSPITASTASWLTAVYQYDAGTRSMKVAFNNGLTAGATATESATIDSKNFKRMNTWFTTLMADTFG